MHSSLLVPRRDDTLYRREFSLNFIAGGLRLRLAETDEERFAAQRLRYRVFFGEMGATPTAAAERHQMDVDKYDDIADHLIVTDIAGSDSGEYVVGTYRLIRRGPAMRCGGFYSAHEFDIAPLLRRPGEILELGRSCVDRDYRTLRVIDLLWQGVAAYISHYNVQILFGCASFPTVKPNALCLELSYLHHYCRADEAIRPVALPGRYVEMNRVSVDAIDRKQGFMAMPPLLKGYLRLGGVVGDGAVVDYDFGTTDVCILVERGGRMERSVERYMARSRALKAS